MNFVELSEYKMHSIGNLTFRFPAYACFLLFLLGVGCAKEPTTVEGDASERLRALARGINQYASSNRGKAPKDEETLKKFLARTMPNESADDLLVSPRDGQPYVVLYGAELSMPDPSSNQGWPPVAYEAEGVEGKRQVAFFSGGVEELDDEAFAAKVPSG